MYAIGLVNFEVYNSIPNIDSSNNKFYFNDDDKVLEIPEGSYEVEDINKHINNNLSLLYDNTNLIDRVVVVSIRSNTSINFENTVGI